MPRSRLRTIGMKDQVKKPNTVSRSSTRKKRKVSNEKDVDLYNFETSEECLKLNFSNEKENKIPPSSKRIKSVAKDINTSLNRSLNEKLNKRPQIGTKRIPAFEFFSMKPKKSRLSDSGVFMTPSPILSELPMTKPVKSVEKQTPTGFSHNDAKRGRVKASVTRKKSYNDANDISSGGKKSAVEQELKSSQTRKRGTNVKTTNKRQSPRFSAKKLDDNSSSQTNFSSKETVKRTKLSTSQKATSTPNIPRRSRSAKHKSKADTIFSPPKVSPVQKVDSPTGNMVTSPDFGGSPSFSKEPRKASETDLQQSMITKEKTESKQVAKKSQVSTQTSGRKLRSKPQCNTVNIDTPGSKDTKAESSHEYNSLMDGSMFAPDSPVKGVPHKDDIYMQEEFDISEKATTNFQEATKAKNMSPPVGSPPELGKSVNMPSYSAEQRIMVKKHGRYSTSKIDAWAKHMNEQFDDFDSYELSVD